MIDINAQKLTPEVFAPFGNVIDARVADFFTINSGRTKRYNDLVDIEILGAQAKPCVSIFVSQGVKFPVEIKSLERHPLGSQAFMPLNRERFLIVVAPLGNVIPPNSVQAFVTDGFQGVNYKPGVWHAIHSVLEQTGEFLVIDRSGPGDNCDEHRLEVRVSD